ncbi:MAG: type II toxin-antitoxin system RelE/ParE family toxin [Bacteroidetes bacterium]|nr:MAG: type II toxin-antitoxin system RelE/ParE family toxin [Bacteroidota bacterium]
MENGYKIVWTVHALNELKVTFEYLENNWTDREISKLANEIDKILQLISNNPKLFPISNKTQIRRAVLGKLNIIYYRELENKTVEIISFFATRRSPNREIK